MLRLLPTVAFARIVTSPLQRLLIAILIICIACTPLLNSCSPGGATSCIGEDMQVSWQLISNHIGNGDSCTASFTFINTGARTIGNNWTMYFNQQTVHPLTMRNPELGRVEHINGDFYRFVPGTAFSLGANDTLRFVYSYAGIIIKTSDAPNGVYITLHDSGDKDSIQLVQHFTVVPFTDLDNLFPVYRDNIPTPASDYTRNLSVSQLNADSICPLIPTPAYYKKLSGNVTLSATSVVYYTSGLEAEANYLVAALQQLFGITVDKHEGNGFPANAIILNTAPMQVNGVTREAYLLDARPGKGINITGSDPAGVFYGIQSMLLLLNNGGMSKQQNTATINAIMVKDAPRFAFRGFLLDVARNFHTRQEVMQLIDLLALYKINTLNLRLTDDEGWRLAIKGLPELTEVGAKRGHTLNDSLWLPPSFGSGPFPDTTGNKGSGYYTREDYIAILRYAQQRHIRVVPEICYPSHARAAIKAMEARYRTYMAKGQQKAAEEYRLIDPGDKSEYYSAQRFTDNIVCVALPAAAHFYESVVDDIVSMYKEAGAVLQVFHTGGDEVPEGAWSQSPLCRKLLQEHPEISGPRNLQGWFFKALLAILEKHKLVAGGWEEVVLNKDSAGHIAVNPAFTGGKVVPYVWDNTGDNIDLGYRIANAGYPVVLCNVTNLYFDLSYNADPDEPGLYWGGFQDAKDPFVLAPFDVFKSALYDDFGNMGTTAGTWPGKQRLLPQNRKNIIGLQAQLWSETLKRPGMMAYYVVPKLFAFAEKAWAPAPAWENEPLPAKRTAAIDAAWNEFANRIGQRELPRLDQWYGGYAYRIPLPGAVVEQGVLKANTAFPGFTIRYTTHGNEPTPQSALYTGPVKVSGNIRLRAFTATGRGGRSVMVK